MKTVVFALVAAVSLMSGAAISAEFGGNDCSDDCSGHKAGYEWAEQNGVTSEEGCSGNSTSFEEGCRTYTEDPSRGADQDDDGNDIE